MKGKVAIVTGGTGVGVAVADVDASRADETATLVSSGGGRAFGVGVDEEAHLRVECRGRAFTSPGAYVVSSVGALEGGATCVFSSGITSF